MEEFERSKNSGPDLEVLVKHKKNETLLLLSRLNNPKIKKQLIDFVYDVENSDTEGGEIVTYSEIEASINKRIDQISSSTQITFSNQTDYPHHTSERMVVDAIEPYSKKRYTSEQLSITEAHEKGHIIRQFRGPMGAEYASRLRKGFDVSQFKFSEKDVHVLSEMYGVGEEEIDTDENRSEYIEYILDPREIVERMSQLKNYFGFSGAEVFTSNHLDYARKHYVDDTDFDNGMTVFLRMITKETEVNFLELINSIGV